MPGKSSSLTVLDARKRLLVLEAELQRGQFGADLGTLGTTVGEVTQQLRRFGAVATGAAVLVGGLSAMRRKASADRQPTVLSRIFSGIRLAASLWLAFKQSSH